MAQVYQFIDDNGVTRLFAEITPDPTFNGGTITAPPVTVVVGADNTDALVLDSSNATLVDTDDTLLIKAGDPDRLSSSRALRVTGKNDNDAARLDAYGILLLQDSTAAVPGSSIAYQFSPFSTRPVAMGTAAGPDGSGNFLAGFHSGGALMTAAHAAPADADLNNGECALWFDQTNGAAKLMLKGKTANGTVATAGITLS